MLRTEGDNERSCEPRAIMKELNECSSICKHVHICKRGYTTVCACTPMQSLVWTGSATFTLKRNARLHYTSVHIPTSEDWAE